MAIYAERFGIEGRAPATFEVITATAGARTKVSRSRSRPGSAKMRLADALGVEERDAGEKAGD